MKQITSKDIFEWVWRYEDVTRSGAERIAERVNQLLAEVAQPERTPLPTVGESCKNCKHWDWIDDEPMAINGNSPWGSCKRYPPVFVSGKDQYKEEFDIDRYRHPFTEEDHWCGEWKPCGKDGA